MYIIKYFNSFRSTMKHHHQKQIAKNFPLQQNGKQKKSGVLHMLKQEQLQREYELLKCQILLNGHLQITCIGTGKNSLAHYELACSKGSGQCREMGNGRKQTFKRVRGREQEDLSPSLPNPAPSPFFLSYFSLLFPNYLKACYRLYTCIPSFPTFYGIYST